MAVERLKVNPTRMELRRLKNRLETATRGHKLLKDKSDEMVRQFIEFAKKNKKLREEIEEQLANALKSFVLAKSICDDYSIEECICMAGTSVELQLSTSNIVSVNVPKIKIIQQAGGEKFPYSFASITAELDGSIVIISKLLIKLIELAEVEKTCNMLAIEIEKNRRRVNALEYIMIPQINDTIKFIGMKLDENDRSNIVRLMKVKEIINKQEV